jgi:SAM-dependent methyltransferase
MDIPEFRLLRGRVACRSCGAGLHPFVDLGVSPLCESFLAPEQINAGEMFYPLHVKICSQCWLAQIGEFVAPDQIFSEYAYFSSYSTAWLEHARAFAHQAMERFGLGQGSFVLELASNDGYLLRNFVERGIPCLGFEPARNVATIAQAGGIPTEVRFWDEPAGIELASREMCADLVVANNVLAQVPDINGFVAGISAVLKPQGVMSAEFPHLLRLLEGNQFDTIYHEHFSYFSLYSIEYLLKRWGLRVFDVEELWTHGGSLRVFACPLASAHCETGRVNLVREQERTHRLQDTATYTAFGVRVVDTKWKLLAMLMELKRQGSRIAGYGAPGKGNTLLNYCGIRTDFLDFTVDRNPYKHGRSLPGSRIPVLPVERLLEARPDYVMILPWNLKEEIMTQLAEVQRWGGRFLIPIPEPTIVN